MEKNIFVEVEPTSKWEHISVILTGLSILEKKNKIKLKIIDNSRKKGFKYSNNAGLELIINGIKCYIDVSDGYNNIDFIKNNIKNCDFYFKRSFSKELNNEYKFRNIYPLGLNYEVYNKDIKYKYYHQKSIKSFLLNLFSKVYIEDLEFNGIYDINNPKICYTVRLYSGNEYEQLNNSRIELVRKLKNKYQNNFCGGVYDSKISRRLCPDLIVNKLITIKKEYLKRMHKCDICIATTGLHNSIGWKFAEYVISGKAIISEKLNYDVPGGFNVNKNYLEFTTPDECIERIDYLLNNKDAIKSLSNNNLEYYSNSLRPEKIVEYVINFVLNKK